MKDRCQNGAMIVYDKDVKTSELNRISEEFERIIINGDLLIDEKLETTSNLTVDGNITNIGERFYEIKVSGNLICSKKIFAGDIEVGECLKCKGVINARNVKVQKDFYCEEEVELATLEVLGDFHAKKALKAKKVKIKIKKSFSCEGIITAPSVIFVTDDGEEEDVSKF